MIITRTPFRVSLFGGGTDLPAFYRRHGHGLVFSAAIRRYMHIVIHPYFQDKIRIKYSRTEDVETVDAIRHPIVRECLRHMGVDRGIEIASFADVASGTGLGSSSAFTVGLLHALYARRGHLVPKSRLAAEACRIEIDILGEPIGKQDQYAAAAGNLNVIRFNADESVDLTPVLLDREEKSILEKHLALYYVGGSRKAGAILAGQQEEIRRDGKRLAAHYETLLSQVSEAEKIVREKRLQDLGPLLNQAWQEKRRLAPGITSQHIDDIYAAARKHGATGGKLLGAGGNGFLLFWHEDHPRLARELGLRSLPFAIDTEGTKILYYEESQP